MRQIYLDRQIVDRVINEKDMEKDIDGYYRQIENKEIKDRKTFKIDRK